MKRRQILLQNSRERAEYGCIVTFENADGKRLVLTAQGAPRLALAKCCDRALALDSSFRVVSYSTPETVYQDLIGRSRFLSAAGYYQRSASPESQVLARIGRGYMAER